jgi:hypothetical protein
MYQRGSWVELRERFEGARHQKFRSCYEYLSFDYFSSSIFLVVAFGNAQSIEYVVHWRVPAIAGFLLLAP